MAETPSGAGGHTRSGPASVTTSPAGREDGLAGSPGHDMLLQAHGLGIDIGGLPVVNDVRFVVRRGECLGLVGETGSGKSLTCRAVTGTLTRRGGRAVGTLRFDGQDLTTMSERAWRQLRGRRIALIPQSSMTSLDPVMRVGAQLRETIRALDPSADAPRRATELLEQVEMPRIQHVLRQYPHELSGGMRQRAMIALAIAGNPDLLVADEPTTALDVTVQARILQLLRSLCDDRGMTLLLVTHDLGVVEEIADRVAVMHAGRTVEHGPVDLALQRPQHPYTRALLAARPAEVRPGDRLQGLGGAPPPAGAHMPGCRFAPRCVEALAGCTDAPPPVVDVGQGHEATCWLLAGAGELT